MSREFRLSIAIPVHNEQSIIPELLQRTLATLDRIEGGPHELVFVDDGSTDQTRPLLEEASRRDPRIVVVSLSRNFGHQAALTAGLNHVTGDAVVVMDGDLQDVPEAIPGFVERHHEGYDVVYAQRIRRKEAWPLRLCYFLFYRIMTKLADVQIPVDAGDFSLMSRRVLDTLNGMPEHHRYLRGLRSWIGFKQIGVAVERDERHSGKSKYSMMRLLKLASDGIFAFSTVPIRAAAILGSLTIFASALYAIYSLVAKFFLHKSPQGFTAVIFMMTFLSGMVLLFLGVIGEYVGRIYEETKGRPLYIVSRVVRGLDVMEDEFRPAKGDHARPAARAGAGPKAVGKMRIHLD